MKKVVYISIIIIFMFASVNSSYATEIESFTINGLKVIFKKNTATDIVAANMYLRGGLTVINPDQAGIENFALIVAQKASKNYPKEKMNAELEKMNTIISSSSGLDFSSLNLLCVKQNFEKSWDIFADILTNPLFNDDDVELERKRMLSAIKQANDDPDTYLRELEKDVFFLNHPYQIKTNGTEETISAFTAEHLKKYMKGRIETSHMLLVVVGNTDQDQLENLIEDSFGNLKKGNYLKKLPPAVKHPVPSIKVVSRELPTKYIRGKYPAPAFGTEEWYSMLVATRVLRDRLFEEVRTKRGLSYAPAAGYNQNFSGSAYIYVNTVDPDTTIKVMITEVKKIKDEPISEKDLADRISVFITSFYMNNETSQSQAQNLAKYEISGVGYEMSEKFIENLKKVTPESVQKVCQKYMENLQFVLLGNPKSLSIENFMY